MLVGLSEVVLNNCKLGLPLRSRAAGVIVLDPRRKKRRLGKLLRFTAVVSLFSSKTCRLTRLSRPRIADGLARSACSVVCVLRSRLEITAPSRSRVCRLGVLLRSGLPKEASLRLRFNSSGVPLRSRLVSGVKFRLSKISCGLALRSRLLIAWPARFSCCS